MSETVQGGRVAGLAIVVLLLAGGASIGRGAEPAPAPPPQPRRPRMPMLRPPVPGLMGELPNTPETPPDKLPAQYFASLGQVHLQHAQWTKAEECYREAYAKEQDAGARGEYAYCLGQLLMRKQEYAKALPLVEEAIKNVPQASRSYQLRRYRTTLAALHEKMNQPEKAEAVYLDWSRDPGSPYEAELARRELLRFWQRTGKLDAAVAKYEAKLKDTPTDKEALDMLRLVYTSVKPDPDKSLALAEQLAELQPDDRNVAMQLLGAYQRARKFDKAIALLEKLMAKSPEESSTLSMQLAFLYIQSGQKDKAQEFAKKMIEKGPESSGTHAQAAGIYSQLNMVDAALAEYEAAAKLAKSDPERERYLLSAAHAAQRAKKYPKAEALAKELAKSSSKGTVSQAKRLLFDLYEEQNKLDQLEVRPGQK